MQQIPFLIVGKFPFAVTQNSLIIFLWQAMRGSGQDYQKLPWEIEKVYKELQDQDHYNKQKCNTAAIYIESSKCRVKGWFHHYEDGCVE